MNQPILNLKNEEQETVLKRFLKRKKKWSHDEISAYIKLGAKPENKNISDVEEGMEIVAAFAAACISPYTGATIIGIGRRLILQIFLRDNNLGTSSKRITKNATVEGVHYYYSFSKKDRERIFKNMEHGDYVAPASKKLHEMLDICA